MDLDADGHLDILSGSYSRTGAGSMAGLFQLLKGSDSGFANPVALTGTDGEPLIVPADEANIVRAICTRPFAADLDGDGHLDLVVGNFEGTFWVFPGEGEGRFGPEPMQLMRGDAPLEVAHHSDPFLVDWDGDGDLDLLSGSAQGGVELFPNTGSRTEPRFGEAVELVPAAGSTPAKEGGPVFGDAHVTGPQGSTRVWADDLNGDGKLDLLVGDSVRFEYPAEGLEPEEARTKLAAWDEEMNAILERMNAGDDELPQEAFSDHYRKRDEIVRTEATGQVWVLYQR